MRLRSWERIELEATLAPYERNERVRKMAAHKRRSGVSTLDHCRNVAEVSWWMCRRFHLRVDAHALLVGALLHDFCPNEKGDLRSRLRRRHAERARRNAVSCFDVDRRTQAVILSHMWPIHITNLPRSREAVVVGLANKYVALHEMVFRDGRRVCG